MYDFKYQAAVSVEEAASLLRSDEDARPLAGGMSIIPTMKHRLAKPASLVDLNALENLRFIDERAGRLTIGAMTIHEAVADSKLVKTRIPALAKLAGNIGDVQVRHRGTLGGSLCHNDPAACYPSAALALDAEIVTNERTIKADDFFRGMFETALTHGELVMEICFPIPEAASYVKFHNMASRFSIVGIFVARFGPNVRIAVTGAGHCVFRERVGERLLAKEFSPDAVASLVVSPEGLINDVHGSAEYRAHLIPVLLRQAISECLGVDTARSI